MLRGFWKPVAGQWAGQWAGPGFTRALVLAAAACSAAVDTAAADDDESARGGGVTRRGMTRCTRRCGVLWVREPLVGGGLLAETEL